MVFVGAINDPERKRGDKSNARTSEAQLEIPDQSHNNSHDAKPIRN
jgi:hypothetical protein